VHAGSATDPIRLPTDSHPTRRHPPPQATSALDTESERIVQAALDNLVVGRTTVVGCRLGFGVREDAGRTG
jgi:hypothetical protein